MGLSKHLGILIMLCDDRVSGWLCLSQPVSIQTHCGSYSLYLNECLRYFLCDIYTVMNMAVIYKNLVTVNKLPLRGSHFHVEHYLISLFCDHLRGLTVDQNVICSIFPNQDVQRGIFSCSFDQTVFPLPPFKQNSLKPSKPKHAWVVSFC